MKANLDELTSPNVELRIWISKTVCVYWCNVDIARVWYQQQKEGTVYTWSPRGIWTEVDNRRRYRTVPIINHTIGTFTYRHGTYKQVSFIVFTDYRIRFERLKCG